MPGMQSAQLTVAFWAVVAGRLMSTDDVDVWPLPPPGHMPVVRRQQGGAPPFDAQAGTVASTWR